MTPKQERFVAEYLVDLNATQAAIRAGYSPQWAGANAKRLTNHDQIRAAIEEGKRKQLDRVQLSADRVLEEIAALAFADLRKLYDDRGRLLPVKDWPDDVAKAVSGVETLKRNMTAGDGEQEKVVKIRTWDKSKNLELLAKHFALLTERVQADMDLTIRWQSD